MLSLNLFLLTIISGILTVFFSIKYVHQSKPENIVLTKSCIVSIATMFGIIGSTLGFIIGLIIWFSLHAFGRVFLLKFYQFGLIILHTIFKDKNFKKGG